MSVLATIFSHSRRIALDIADIMRRLIKGRSEEQNYLLGVTDELFIDRAQGFFDPVIIGRAGNRGP